MKKYSAVIVDDRKIDDQIIKNHLKFLPKDWFLNVWSTRDYYIDVPHYRHYYKGSGSPIDDYNKQLASPGFWEKLVKYERVLIFQQDSGILKPGIEEFLQWSYVGAPWFKGASWSHKDRVGGNGGLSIREPKEMLRVCERWNPSKGNEDIFFTHHCNNVAPYEVCKKFSVETEFQLNTFGYHAIDKYLSKSQVDQILK